MAESYEPPADERLRVTVVNGNLRFVPEPLMLGHYRSVALTGTERVMDQLVGGSMSVSLALGHYPVAPETNAVFINRLQPAANPLQMPRPHAVIVVGLGDEGNLRLAELAKTVCAGVIAWARRVAETQTDPRPLELAATLIGSGGTGISAGQSASLVVQGVLDANERLAGSPWPRVRHLRLIELYLDRATEAWRALRIQARGVARLTVPTVIETAGGALRSPIEGGYRGARYDLITATSVPGPDGTEAVSYVVDTRRARAEVHAHGMQRPLLRDLVSNAANDENDDTAIRRTLFRLLVPVELESFLTGAAEAVIQVDQGTAGIPWELLDAGSDDPNARPWAIGARLLRKLQTKEFQPPAADSGALPTVLIVGEPACDPNLYDPLPAAREEAEAIADCLKKAAVPLDVREMFSRDADRAGAEARTIINTLVSGEWRIVHIAGHGEEPERDADGTPRGDPRGVVLSDRIFWGPREIRGLRTVPELVFVNCCHLARGDSDALLNGRRSRAYDRPQFAATVAEALIQAGVRCVVAAGWAVEDEPAKTFATTFYRELVNGSRFIDAVGTARLAAYDMGGNTWAAYQCYGDPDWTFVSERAGGADHVTTPEAAFANVASPTALVLALETLAVNSSFDDRERKGLAEKLAYLEGRFGDAWGGMGAVAEAFGAAWAQRDRAKAAEWYARALQANDGRASLRAAEQLGNLRARQAWESVDAAAGAEAAPEALDAARGEIRSALELLERVADLQSSIERESLCGSAWKRLALVEAIAGDAEAERKAVESMRQRYARAEALARDSGHVELFYPALNRMAAELITAAREPDWHGFDAAGTDEVRASLLRKVDADPDFWSVAGLVEVELYEAVARGGLADARAALQARYADLHQRVGSDWMWASVYDQARFVLSPYRARAAAPEQEACDALLESLGRYAGKAPAPVQPAG